MTGALTLSLIGIGCGDPAQLTLAGVRAINAADLVLIPRKGEDKSDLAELRRAICAQVLTNAATRLVEFALPRRNGECKDYRRSVEDWHDAVAATWSRQIADNLGSRGRVAILIWGDPSLYDSSLRIARRLDPAPMIEVIPGITAIQALCAAHALPLNDIGEPFLVTTGRRLREGGWPQGAETVVVMLDGGAAFQSLDPSGFHIWWGAYLGMPDQIILSGALADVGATIVEARRMARERHGWIMDSYILKRVSGRDNIATGDSMLPEWVCEKSPDISIVHREAARARQGELTKPAGSLGRLETLAIELAGLQHTERPRADRVPIIICAGDHGIAAHGVSAFPQEVTIAMMANFCAGGAAISVLARELGSQLEVVDAGTLAEQPMPGVVTDKPRRGSRDFSKEAALDVKELAYALDCGKRAVARAAASQPDLLILGEMGIGNTTSAAAIAAALLKTDAETIAGAGTGLDAAGRAHKARVIDAALACHGLKASDVSAGQVLCAVGGLEIAAISGAVIAAAQQRIPVLVDGFIASVGALAASRINASCRPYLIFSHRSAEQGHRLVLEALDARPLLDLDLRLGEGSGAALAVPILRLACALHNRMATFAEAAVPDRKG